MAGHEEADFMSMFILITDENNDDVLVWIL